MQSGLTISDIVSGLTRDTTVSIIDLIDTMAISQRMNVPPASSRYTAVMHADLCRMKMLGLGDVSCAQAVGITPATLRGWLAKFPILQMDMDRAAALSKVEVVRLLFGLMQKDGPTAFQAIRLFLTSRTEEFKEKSEIKVTAINASDLALSIRSMYGIKAVESVVDGELPPPPAGLPEPAAAEEVPDKPVDDPFGEI